MWLKELVSLINSLTNCNDTYQDNLRLYISFSTTQLLKYGLILIYLFNLQYIIKTRSLVNCFTVLKERLCN